MRHIYLTKKDIYFATAQKHITKQESRELIKKLDVCTNAAVPTQAKRRPTLNEIDMRTTRDFGSFLLKGVL